MSIAIGDYVKNKIDGRVFKVIGFTGGRQCIPDNWLIDRGGIVVNLAHCEIYQGALSAIPEAINDIDCGYKIK